MRVNRSNLMKLIAITPIHVTDAELARRQERYQRIAPAGVTIELRNLEAPAAPTALDQESDVRKSDSGIAQTITELNEDGFDFVMPDCVLDPGFRPAANRQVVGMLETVVSHLAEQGERIGAVTRNESIGAELVRRVGEYGHADKFVGLEVLNLSFDAINDEELWHEALAKAVDVLAEKGATVVINGCSAVNVNQAQIKLPVVDPAELALKLIVQSRAAAN